jgi:lipopolysaccharide transport system permease protein
MPTSPLPVLESLTRYRHLVWQMSKREVIGRYRGSMLGLLWSFVHPLCMLGIYTFVFGVIFHARWGEVTRKTHLDFALVLFAGLIVYTLFAECITRAPWLVTGNPNYVKKVVFPLEILPVVAMGTALFHATVSFAVLLLLQLGLTHALPWQVLTVPLILLPLILLTVGLSWFLATCGVYVRDTGHTITLLLMMLLFASPVFYPASALPGPLRQYMWLNPLTYAIEEVRGALFLGKTPSWMGLGIYLCLSLVVAWLGYLSFQKTRPGFADVV